MIPEPRPSLAPIQRKETLTLSMAHLSYCGLSEDWWLRHLGDVHWQLIADAVGQHTTVFRDAEGRQIYAAFCTTEFEQSHPDRATLGTSIELRSELWAGGTSRLQSNHILLCDNDEIARFRFVSAFVTHREKGVNASVSRATPYLLPVIPAAPDDFAQQASALARSQRSIGPIESQRLALRPGVGTDFNAVGLLYFPSYTRMFEQVEAQLSSSGKWSPVRNRLVSYFGNIELGETLIGSRAGGDAAAWALWRKAKGKSSSDKLAHCICERY